MKTKTVSRRAIVAGAATAIPLASVAALRPAALAASAWLPSDPIFAAIEVHRARRAAHEGACEVYVDLELYKPEVVSAPETLALKRTVEAASDEMAAAEMALINVSPTTIGGAVALLRYANEVTEKDGVDSWPDWVVGSDGDEDQAESWTFLMHAHVADALERIAATGDQAVQS